MGGEWHEDGTMTGEWNANGTMSGEWTHDGTMTGGEWSHDGTGEWAVSEDGTMTGGDWTHTATWEGDATTMTAAEMEVLMNSMNTMAGNATAWATSEDWDATMGPMGGADWNATSFEGADWDATMTPAGGF